MGYKNQLLLIPTLLFFLVLQSQSWAVEVRPKRIVSYDLCIDQILLGIVPPQNVAALTFLSQDKNYSTVAAEAALLPITKGSVEDAFKYKSDLILLSSYEKKTKIHLLKKLGFNVAVFKPARTISELREHISRLGQLTGYKTEAAHLIAQIDRDVITLSLQNSMGKKSRKRAIFLAANRHTQGENSVVSTLFKLSGYENIAVEEGLRHGGFIGLEKLLASEPDYMVIARGEENTEALAIQKLAHPAMTYLNKKMRQINIEQKYVLCLTPKITEAAAKLRQVGKNKK